MAWCSFTDGKCSKWPEAALPEGEAALLKIIEAKSRAAYLAVFSGKHNPAGLEAGRMLREHPEISFRTGLYRETTAVNWCVEEERAIARQNQIRTELLSRLKARRNL